MSNVKQFSCFKMNPILIVFLCTWEPFLWSNSWSSYAFNWLLNSINNLLQIKLYEHKPSSASYILACHATYFVSGNCIQLRIMRILPKRIVESYFFMFLSHIISLLICVFNSFYENRLISITSFIVYSSAFNKRKFSRWKIPSSQKYGKIASNRLMLQQQQTDRQTNGTDTNLTIW